MAKARARTETATPSPAGSGELYLGDAIHFFLSAKRAGGRSERTIDDYRKKLELFQRWAAQRLGGEDAVDASYIDRTYAVEPAHPRCRYLPTWNSIFQR